MSNKINLQLFVHNLLSRTTLKMKQSKLLSCTDIFPTDFKSNYKMQHLFLLILLGFSVVAVIGRPSQRRNSEEHESQEDLEYEEDKAPSAEENLDGSQFGDEAPEYKTTKSRDARNDKFYENVNNDEFQTYGKRRRFIEDSEENEQLEAPQRYANQDANNFKSSRLHNEMLLASPLSKRTFNSRKAQTEEGELLFENNRDQTIKLDKNDNINEPVDVNRRSSYTKQYYNQVTPDRSMLDVNNQDNDFLYYTRDRRETKNQGDADSISGDESGKENLEQTDNQNEEMAIKRHIKKMTGDELEQLLISLSDEKRALLKKIMDDDDMSEKSYDSINKREITKKAGAVEDNGFIDNGPSESSKLQGFSSLEVTTTYPATQSSDGTTTKQSDSMQDSTELSSQQKTSQDTNPGNKADLNGDINRNEEKFDNSYASDTDPNKITQNAQSVSKTENKREVKTETALESDQTGLEDSKRGSEDSKEFLSDDSYFLPQDEDMSQFMDDVEQSRSYDSSKIYKRNVDDQTELDSKLKSLEESFPSVGAYDDSGPYSGPLIRVKRKNTEQIMKKRSAAIFPDAKVGYYPYKSDNNDDDSDEGNEFDDDGFYDPSPNLVSSDNKNVVENTGQAGRDTSCKLNTVEQPKVNLGSDTDNVLSGVEGVDENLMFSSGTRSRRMSDGYFVERVEGNSLVQSEQSKSLNGETLSNNDVNVPNYQDNDSFGGFPRSYEGDLGRYKRIRRVKQSHVPEAPASA